MAARSTNAFRQQADHLYTRGVAAARGGQKAVAARLLQQAVKLNPQHEQAWLWLSGVLEQPADIAFCLRAVLGINPDNERARKGLAWLEQHDGERARAVSHTFQAPATIPAADGWWASWRAKQSTWLWTLRALLLIPIVLIGSTLGIRELIVAQPLPRFVTYRDLPQPTAVPTPATPPTPTAGTSAQQTERTAIVAYFTAINQERRVLQAATETYRTTTDGGRTTVERATAAKQLLEQIQLSREKLSALQAPPEIAATHQLYVEGLAIEQDALEQVVEYYRTYDVALMNRAALRLQDARTQIATATASWDAFAKQQSLKPARAGGREEFAERGRRIRKTLLSYSVFESGGQR